MAQSAGIKVSRMISARPTSPRRTALRERTATAFVLLRINDGPPPSFKRNMSPASCRERFRAGVAAAARA